MIVASVTAHRNTKYCAALVAALRNYGHASNIDLLRVLRKQYPKLSATTVHRATARLSARKVIGIAPNTKDGSIRYDADPHPHDHFLCSSCDLLRDTNIKAKITPIIEESIGDCRISGRLTISGICKKCIRNNRKDYL